MGRKKRETRMQKEARGQPSGKSKYAAKVERRRRLAAKLGVSDTPLPVLIAAPIGEDLPVDLEHVERLYGDQPDQES